jgi:hypothetical protein
MTRRIKRGAALHDFTLVLAIALGLGTLAIAV